MPMRGMQNAYGAKALALALAGLIMPAGAMADTASSDAAAAGSPATTTSDIFNPTKAPVIVVKVTAKVRPQVSQANGETVISQKAIENKPGLTNFTQVIAATVPGVAAAATGEIHIRGSHGQYSYYLDGAPLPADVTGSFSDLINPKNIETLRVYTGGFPAQYGGQLAAIFDVTAKAGQVGAPGGFIQQLAQSYDDWQTTGQVGGSSKDVSYFFSGVRQSTASDISPVSEGPLHDAGNQTVGFSKIDYQAGANDRITLDTAVNSADLSIPNTPLEQNIGVDDSQLESGDVNNLIWRRTHGGATSRLVYYSHMSHLKYDGSPQDLLSTPDGSPLAPSSVGLAETNEDQTATYNGLRFDDTTPTDKYNKTEYGFDVDYVKVNENFQVTSVVNTDADPNGPITVRDETATELGNIYGGDRSAYIQDDYTPGRTHLDYGVRYDQHNAEITTSQFSPRVNLDYTASHRDTFRLYYDRLFQPASLEDVKQLTSAASSTGITTQKVAPFQPERDNFYQGGWTRQIGNASLGFDAYYRDEINTIDDDVVGSSQVDVPVNFTKGYTKGLEATLDGDFDKQLSYYMNFARSWAQEAGPITGGLDYGTTTPGYIFDDHDETNSASFGLDYENSVSFANFDGEYGSGFPYFGNNNLSDLEWTHPHLTLGVGGGTKAGNGQVALTVDNIFNHAYVIKQAGPFTNIQWSLGREYGVKFTQNF
jgi:hypothetical protein